MILEYSKLVFVGALLKFKHKRVHCFTYFSGSKVTVRCVRLLKPYIKKGVAEEDDDDDEDEDDDGGAGRGGLLTEGRIMEKDLLTQAYHISMFDLFLKLRNKKKMKS